MLKEQLTELGACREALNWVEDRSLADAWQDCSRADWMLWLVGRMAGKTGWATQREVVLAACACAETALKYVPAGEDRPRQAIETTRAWCDGRATLDDVRKAAAAAAAADYAASASVAAADYAAAAYSAAASASAAADSAAAAAYSDDASKTRNEALAAMASLVREIIPVPFQPS